MTLDFFADKSVVKFAPHSFQDPYAYLDREETTDVIDEYFHAILRTGNFNADIFKVNSLFLVRTQVSQSEVSSFNCFRLALPQQ